MGSIEQVMKPCNDTRLSLQGYFHVYRWGSSYGVISNFFVQNHFSTWTKFESMVSHEKKLSNTKGRSDIGMPWAVWKGELTINWDVTKEHFGEEYVRKRGVNE